MTTKLYRSITVTHNLKAMKQFDQIEGATDHLDPRIACLIHLFIFEALTTAQQEELDNWVNENDTNRLTFSAATSGHIVLDGVDFLDHEIPVNNPLEKIKQKLRFVKPAKPQPAEKSKPIRYIIPYWRWVAAASIIFVLGVGTALYLSQDRSVEQSPDISPGKNIATLNYDGSNVLLDQSNKGLVNLENSYSITSENGFVKYTAGARPNEKSMRLQHLISTPAAGTYSLLLSDGTKVWLNPSSSISFTPVFPGNERKVMITGEAFFEVAQQVMANGMKKPFIVEVKGKDMRVEVLGTHFNINAYADEPTIRTTLIEGSVKVIISGQATLLKPGQQADVSNKNIDITDISISATEAVKAWKEGNFDFQKSDAESMLREIGRWYDKQVVYNTPILSRHFGGQITRATKLTDVIGALKQYGIVCKISGKKIVVLSMAQTQ
jgi:hypothetical protein